MSYIYITTYIIIYTTYIMYSTTSILYHDIISLIMWVVAIDVLFGVPVHFGGTEMSRLQAPESP